MPLVQRFADFVADLQHLEKASVASQATTILDAFTRHTPFSIGALYLRESRDAAMRLAAKSQQCVAPEILDGDGSSLSLEPRAHIIVPLQSHRDHLRAGALA